MALTFYTEHKGTYLTRLHGTPPQEDVYLHGHHSNDFRYLTNVLLSPYRIRTVPSIRPYDRLCLH